LNNVLDNNKHRKVNEPPTPKTSNIYDTIKSIESGDKPI